MKVQINDEMTEIPDGLTITALLAHQRVKRPDMVSVQLNGTIVERRSFPSTPVRENDHVDFLYFMGGGARQRGVGYPPGTPDERLPPAEEEPRV